MFVAIILNTRNIFSTEVKQLMKPQKATLLQAQYNSYRKENTFKDEKAPLVSLV